MTHPTDEIRNALKALPGQDYRDVEGRIRMIHSQISALTDDKDKQQLEADLNKAAGLGLSEELNELMKKNGLALKALVLVLKYLTNVPDLAQHLYETEKSKLSEEGLGVVSQRLGPQLEVLGFLRSTHGNVSKESIIKLIEEAPSFREFSRISAASIKTCCEGLHPEEEDAVFDIVWKAESIKYPFIPDPEYVTNNAQKKKEEEKKLEEAKALLTEAKKLCSADLKWLKEDENKTALNKNITNLLKKLDLPPDWCKQENILQTIAQEIWQIEGVIKSVVPYDSLRKIVTKASEGLALRGVYYSEYAPPITASIPILLPPDEVESHNPQGPFDEKFLKFTEEETADKFAQTTRSSGFNAAIATVGSSGLIDGEIGAAGGYKNLVTDSSNTKISTSSVSVTKLTRIVQKAFQIRPTNMRLTVRAKIMALSIVDENDIDEQKNVARKFFEQYGSHVCGGVHNLGGMFFFIAAAHSNKETNTSLLREAVTKRLDSKLSANVSGAGFEGGGRAMFEVVNEEIMTDENEIEDIELTLSYSIKSIGPNAKNPETLRKLLSTNNATWAVLDRGETCSYIPVWELLKANEYKKSASVMKQTWEEEEVKRKKEFDEKREEEKKTSMKRKSKKELEELKIMYLNKKFSHGLSPTVANVSLFSKFEKKSKAEAFTKAVNFISEDPEVAICEISLNSHLLHEDYSLKCWKASRDQTMTYELKRGRHVLFYSQKYYLWQKGIANC